MLNVGESTVSRARKVIENAVPELVAAVERGEVSVTAAAKATELPEEEQREMAAEKAAPKAKRPRKTRKDKGKKRATDPAVAAALAEVETLLKRWESMRDLKKLVSEWEDEKRWTFCETLARLSRVLRQLSQDLKHHVPA
jgi:hypothetical protein